MLNYIWAGLIIISLVFALTTDIKDISENTYQNGVSQEIIVRFPKNEPHAQSQRVRFRTPDMDTLLTATWHVAKSKTELVVPITKALPKHWEEVANHFSDNTPDHMSAVVLKSSSSDSVVSVMLPKVQFVKLRAITQAAFDMATFSVKLAIGLIGIMALWLGLMRVAEKSGLIYKMVKVVQPFLHFLFPNIPKDHPALGAISLNFAANMLGLGNAATPLGIKAMEEMQKLNPNKDEATNAMCMFLTINTASIQLVPPVTLVAIMGIRIGELFTGIILVTFFSLVIGIIAAKIFEKRNPEAPAIEWKED
ncbi:MAG TPA: nucleoside recognition domain-containing protein [Balneolales bacterium]|nr:nucleoside recognition domain-containing protein [Balneolales bacterium]